MQRSVVVLGVMLFLFGFQQFAPALAHAAQGQKPAKAKKAVNKLDTNGDGKVDKTEREAAKQAAIQRKEEARAKARAKAKSRAAVDPAAGNATLDKKRKQLIAKYDKNHDGKLDAVEMQKAQEDIKAKADKANAAAAAKPRRKR